VGASIGALTASTLNVMVPSWNLSVEAFAMVGMSTFFAAVVRAPITGVVLIVEMTATTTVLIPMLLAAGIAMVICTIRKAPPIYDTLRMRMKSAA
jgi:CIC family chloride channel protein